MSRTVEIKRSGATAKDDPNCFNRLHWALPPVAKANPGDYIIYETRDAFDDQLGSAATPADVAGADLTRVHPMTARSSSRALSVVTRWLLRSSTSRRTT